MNFFIRELFLLLFALLLIFPSPAYAYVDASLVSVFIQGIIAVVAGGLVLLKLYWRRVKEIVGKVLNRATDKSP